MMDTFNFTGVVVKEDQGFSSICLELDVASQGETVARAKTMLLEAAALHLEGAFEDGLCYLRPVPLTTIRARPHRTKWWRPSTSK